MEYCLICSAPYKIINSFVFKCEKCLFLKSNLKSGNGREIEGISELRRKNFRNIIKVIKSLNNHKKFKILEIGSGSGYFIEECIKSELDITGSEANDEEFTILKKKFSKILKISLPLKEIGTENFTKFDYIVFNDVFEHLENLDKVIDQLKIFLNEDGKILINLPSSDGVIFKFSNILKKIGINNFYDRLWQRGLSSPHLSYFNNKNLSILFEKYGYELLYSSSLDTVSKNGNYERLNSTIKSKIVCMFMSFILILFFYLQKLLPRDIIFHVYHQKKN